MSVTELPQGDRGDRRVNKKSVSPRVDSEGWRSVVRTSKVEGRSENHHWEGGVVGAGW